MWLTRTMMKLSKGVLGLKFMRKTREQIVKEDTEKKHREHSKRETATKPSSSAAQVKIEPEAQSQSKSTECKVIACPSYLHCERFNYPRQSYGGMNPSVEENVRMGHWSMEYEISDEELQIKEEVEEFFIVKEEVMDDNVEDGEIESNSEEEDKKASEGPIFGSIIATIGRKFNRKAKKQNQKEQQQNANKNRGKKRHYEDPERHDNSEIANKKRKRGFWRKKNQKNNK